MDALVLAWFAHQSNLKKKIKPPTYKPPQFVFENDQFNQIVTEDADFEVVEPKQIEDKNPDDGSRVNKPHK